MSDPHITYSLSFVELENGIIVPMDMITKIPEERERKWEEQRRLREEKEQDKKREKKEKQAEINRKIAEEKKKKRSVISRIFSMIYNTFLFQVHPLSTSYTSSVY